MSTISIAGGHGQIALLLTRQLADDGHIVRCLVRDPGHQADVAAAGGQTVIHDLEADDVSALAAAIEGSDAVVFAAGAGPGSGAARKETVDHRAAVDLMAACQAVGVDRYVMISAMGTDDPPGGDSVFEVYLRAKARADEALMASELDWTIIRPGRLTDGAPTGTVTLARHVPRGEIPRADVAAVVAACLDAPDTIGLLAEVVGGDSEITTALSHAVA